MEALQSGRSPQKNNGGKVNVCLVETAEQLVAFGHDGLRSSSGQNALGPPFIGFIHTAPVCSATTAFYIHVRRAIFFQVRIFLCCRYSVTRKAESAGFVHAGYQVAGII